MQERTRSSRSSRSGRGAQGERRIITVLFCDVTGSTALAEQLDPEEWTEIMNEAFDYMTQPVARYEGTVARLMGDGILAFFGAPIAHEDDPQRAILAGLDILDGVTEFREELRDEYGIDFNVRVGINTGPVVVGDVGSELAGEYTAMGDAVNLAARMEQTARPGMLQISEDTRQLVAPLFDMESLGEIDVKGKVKPVSTYQVLRPKSAPGRLRAIEISEEIGNLWGNSGALSVTTLPYIDRGEIERCIENGQISTNMAIQIDMGFFELALRAIMGWCCGASGLFDQGLEFLKTDKHKSEEGADFFSLINIVKAHLYLLKGEPDEANECIMAAYGSLDMNDLNPAFRIYIGAFKFMPATVIGDLLWEMGRYERLREFAESSRQLMESRQNRTYALAMLRLKGQAEFELGLYDDARETLILARDRAQELDSKRNLWQALLYLSKVERTQNGADSENYLNQSRQIAQQIVDGIQRSDVRQAYLSLPQVREVLQTA